MTAEEFEGRIIAWAERNPAVEALILAGSRAKPTAGADRLADWDFHLISNRPEQFQGTAWLEQIAPVWCAHSERTPRGVIKVSAIFEGGWEADFVSLATRRMKLVYWGMRHPEWKSCMPLQLKSGIQETRAFLLGSGYRLVSGANGWKSRLNALEVDWPVRAMSVQEFENDVSGFWQQGVWICKKIVRAESRSAMHWLHKLVTDRVYTLLAEEARLAGRPARPESRKAEQWLDGKRLEQTAIVTSIDRQVLAHALLTEILLFEDVSHVVASARGFALRDYSAVATWMRAELSELATSQ